jgi:UPF0271 protein
LENFGRVERTVGPDEAARIVLMQIEQLHEVAGAKLRHVKLHGALYNQVSASRTLAEAVVEELARLWPNLILYALSGSELVSAAQVRGLRVAEEVFADRTYQPQGRLTPRSQPDALIQDEKIAVAQVLRMVEQGVVRATDGSDWPIQADTICVHGDGPQAVAFAKRLRRELAAAGVTIKPFGGT